MKKMLIIIIFLCSLSPFAGADVIDCFTTTADGFIQSSSSTWATAKSGSSLTATSNNNTQYVGAYKYLSDFYVFRAFFYFDTSAIPLSATITDVKLYVHLPANALGSSGVIVAQKSTQGSTLSTSDFSEISGSEYGHVSVGSTEAGWRNITFNETGRSDVIKGPGAVTKISLRDYNYDYLDAATGPTNNTTAINMSFAETGSAAYLTVTYTTPPAISGVLKDKESDASGTDIDYLVIDLSDGAIVAAGTSDSGDGVWSEELASTDPVSVFMLDLTAGKVKNIGDGIVGE